MDDEKIAKIIEKAYEAVDQRLPDALRFAISAIEILAAECKTLDSMIMKHSHKDLGETKPMEGDKPELLAEIIIRALQTAKSKDEQVRIVSDFVIMGGLGPSGGNEKEIMRNRIQHLMDSAAYFYHNGTLGSCAELIIAALQVAGRLPA